MRRLPASPLQEIGLTEARTIAIRQLRLSPFERAAKGSSTTTIFLTACAEALRTSLWALSRCGEESVTTTKILNAAARLVLPISRTQSEGSRPSPRAENSHGQSSGATPDETVRDHLRLALEELEAIGDLAPLPYGRWLPAPIRVVPLRAAGWWLLVGGHPTMLFPGRIANSIMHNGVARLLQQAPSDFGISLPEQQTTDWCRMPIEQLTEWTERKLTEAQLSPYEGDGEFEIYAPVQQQTRPARSRTLTRCQRWHRSGQILPDGRYLVRLVGRSGSKLYAIGQITNGVLSATGPIENGFGNVRRLMYGIDAIFGCPRPVVILPERSNWKFRVWTPFPPGEHRLVMAMSRDCIVSDGRDYPREWVVPSELAPEVVQALRRLCVEPVDRSGTPFNDIGAHENRQGR